MVAIGSEQVDGMAVGELARVAESGEPVEMSGGQAR
jgi:hypothetical protein